MHQLLTRNAKTPDNIQHLPQVTPVKLIPISTETAASHSAANFEWTWTFSQPPVLALKDNMWMNECAFIEYNHTAHEFEVLCQFHFFAAASRPALVVMDSTVSSEIGYPGYRRTSIASIDSSNPQSPVLSPSFPDRTPAPSTHYGHKRESSGGSGLGTEPTGIDISELDDGPEFRRTISALEKKTVNLKATVKKTLKQATVFFDTIRRALHAGKEFVQCIAAIPEENSAAAQSCDFMQRSQTIIGDGTENFLNQTQSLLIEPLGMMYDEIKKAERRKKEFDQESSEYNYLQDKYLKEKSYSKKRNDIDVKYQAKKIKWAETRFDYYCFLNKLHGSDTETQLSFMINIFAEKQIAFFDLMAKKLSSSNRDPLRQLSVQIEQSSKTVSILKKKDEETKRKFIHLQGPEVAAVDPHGGGDGVDASPGSPLTPGTAEAKFKGIRDLQSHDADTADYGRRNQGYLNVAGTQKMADTNPKVMAGGFTWKKLWCVLRNGRMMEYSEKLKPPVVTFEFDLRTCTVREARNVDRRFCFEILGPHIGRRLYQATDGETLKVWLGTIQNAIEGSLNGTSSYSETPDGGRDGEKGDGPTVTLPGPSKPLYAHKLEGKAHSSHRKQGSDVSRYTMDDGPRVIDSIREFDPGNTVCVDCGAKSPEWASINLGCILCIDCSGIHRGMGTHISKIRSLTLDVTSWTPDLLAVMRAIGNTHSNAIWEATLGNLKTSPKPKSSDSREVKAAFIRDKYVNRLFVDKASPWPPGGKSPYDFVLDAVRKNDIPQVMQAVAYGFDLSESSSTHRCLLHEALGFPRPPPGQPLKHHPHLLTKQLTGVRTTGVFAMAEFLIQNRVNVDAVDEVPAVPGMEYGGVNEGPLTRRMTCLHYAALYNELGTLTYLCGKGADPKMKDAVGRTPQDLVELGKRLGYSQHSSVGAKSDYGPGLSERDSDIAAQCLDRLRDAAMHRHH
ncbi:hypothetical protein HK104_008398 [Borealophlyctis nickersoniae]|nr:hypothetical protein HK104_008398 [Borealophlyctis nickersoniae]